MLTTNVELFLRKAHADPVLCEEVNQADSFQALEELSQREGAPAAAGEFRAAFHARNARVLVELMMRGGVMDPVELDPVPALDPDLWARVESLDLSPMVFQLVTYLGWTPQRAAAAERRYRRFFYLKTVLPNGMASPTRLVDDFWHQHIINTRNYEPDCLRVAGRFLHHTFLSFDDPAEAGELSAVWLNTWTCYESLFEEPYQETAGAALLQRWPNLKG